MNGLPLEFKLFLNGKHVGYEKHILDGIMEIWHSLDGETWHSILDAEGSKYIQHDEKRQWTGCVDKYRNNVYFGDWIIHEKDEESGMKQAMVRFKDGRTGCYLSIIPGEMTFLDFMDKDYSYYITAKG